VVLLVDFGIGDTSSRYEQLDLTSNGIRHPGRPRPVNERMIDGGQTNGIHVDTAWSHSGQLWTSRIQVLLQYRYPSSHKNCENQKKLIGFRNKIKFLNFRKNEN
jgi:hypothetical protein